jgi:hypothetical protein
MVVRIIGGKVNERDFFLIERNYSSHLLKYRNNRILVKHMIILVFIMMNIS